MKKMISNDHGLTEGKGEARVGTRPHPGFFFYMGGGGIFSPFERPSDVISLFSLIFRISKHNNYEMVLKLNISIVSIHLKLQEFRG